MASPFLVGNKYIFNLGYRAYVGRLLSIYDTELVFEDAYQVDVHDDDDWAIFIKRGFEDFCERKKHPIISDLIVTRSQIRTIFVFKHDLPTV